MCAEASGARWPRITVVTPSFNQSQYLDVTIRSVLDEKYPNLEYIVIDGGSSDESVDIIRKYESQLAFWVSEADRGQSHAINKGFARATGDIMAWINSDDYYLPGALWAAAQSLRSLNADFIYGASLYLVDKGPYPLSFSTPRLKAHEDLSVFDYIVQPSTFWTRRAWEQVGPLRVDMRYAFDWEFFIRVGRVFRPTPVDAMFSVYRIHHGHKTGTGGDERNREIVDVVTQFAPAPWREAYRAVAQTLLPRLRKVRRATGIPRDATDSRRLARWLKYLCSPDTTRRFGRARIRTILLMLSW